MSAIWRWNASSWINLVVQWSFFYLEHFVHLQRHLESVIHHYPACIFQTNKQKLNSLKITNEYMKCCSVAVESSFTCSSVSMQRLSDEKMKGCHWSAQGSFLTAYLLHFIRSISSSFKLSLGSPTHWPPPGWVYFAVLWNHKSFVLSPASPKVFLMVGLKCLREGEVSSVVERFCSCCVNCHSTSSTQYDFIQKY